MEIKTRQEYLSNLDRLNELEIISQSINELHDDESSEYSHLTELTEEYESKYPYGSLYHPISCIRIEMEDRGISGEDMFGKYGLTHNFKAIMEGHELMNLTDIRQIHDNLGIGYGTLCEVYSMPDPMYPE
jgi:antitoxin component HigA of HigAB toxin-antitoxin module